MSKIIIHDCEQGSDIWFALKTGVISASNFSVAKAKKGTSGRTTLMKRLAVEHITGIRDESTFTTKYMENGTELEDGGREHYEALTGVKVQQIGFAQLNEFIGCSPDGLIGEPGGLELKAPKRTTHTDYIIGKKAPTIYLPQIQGNMWVCEREWWDFMSFCPSYKQQPEFIIRVYRDEDYIKDLSEKVYAFVEEMKVYMGKLTNKPY